MEPTPNSETDLKWLLIDTPRKIKEKSLHILKLTEAVENQRKHVEKMKAPYIQAVNSNKELTNLAKRDVELEELLVKDKVYTDASDILANEKRQLWIATIEETYLRDMFSAYKVMAGMEKME